MPLSEVVANYAEVAATLRGGVFEWMLGENGRRRLSSDCALPDALAHPFLVFTRTRSGSRWFVDTVRRLGENVANAKELAFDGRHEAFAAACASATPSPACVCALRRVFARAHAERRNSYRTALGFKFMTHVDTSNQQRHHKHGTHPFASLTALASAVCEMELPYVLLLRRNVLRREISNEAAKMRGSASHAATAAAAADLRRFRPSIRIHGLVARLADEYDQNERLASLFRDRCGDARLWWYEDVVDRPDWATIMYQLGLWPAPDASRLRVTTLTNTTHVVHGALPIRSLISNYDKVARALRPTKFKWMLE